MKVYAFTCGWLKAPMEAFVEGGEGDVRVPVPAYFIDHPKGRAVFDTGMPAGLRDDPAGTIGAFLAGIFQADFTADQDIDRHLEAIDVDPGSIDIVINSHLHFDHCAGNALLPNARIIVQRREADAARAAPGAQGSFDPRAMLAGRDVSEIDGEHDVFGDGSVVLLPTYGHTAGHQSLKLSCDGGDTILAGDCCYFHRTLRDLKLPPFAHDREEQLRSIARLRALEEGGARIVAGHDPAQWAAIETAPHAFIGAR